MEKKYGWEVWKSGKMVECGDLTFEEFLGFDREDALDRILEIGLEVEVEGDHEGGWSGWVEGVEIEVFVTRYE